MGKEFNYSKMGINMMEITLMVSQMVMEYFIGKLAKYMMDSGKMGWKKEMEFGKVKKVKAILANGNQVSLMDMEYKLGKTMINIKDNLLMD